MNTILCEAIEKRLRVRFEYGGGARLAEVHVYGRDKAGDDLIRAYQVSGHSNSGVPTGWKMFRVEEIGNLMLTNETITGTRPDYNADDPVMETVYCRL